MFFSGALVSRQSSAAVAGRVGKLEASRASGK